jgi:hypothetical protein
MHLRSLRRWAGVVVAVLTISSPAGHATGSSSQAAAQGDDSAGSTAVDCPWWVDSTSASIAAFADVAADPYFRD